MKPGHDPARDLHAAAAAATDFVLRDVGETEPGATIAILHGRELLTLGARGRARLTNGAPMNRRTLARIASITKPMTAQAVAALVRRGLFSLEDRIGDLLPELAKPQADASILHLLSMKAGLREELSLAYLAAGDGAANNHSLDQRLELVKAEPSLNFSPGARTLYCNTHYSLLQRACERACGVAFAELLHTHVFAPAAMRTAAFAGRDAIFREGVGVGYRRLDAGEFKEAEALHEPGAAGGVLASLDDLIAWHDWNRNGADGLWAVIAAPQVHADGSPSAYGLGIEHQVLSGRRLFGHAGALGGWASDYIWLPDEDLAVIILANRNDLNWVERAREAAILTLGLASDGGATPRLSRPEAPTPDWTELYGDEALGSTFSFSAGGGELKFGARWMTRRADGRFARTVGVEPFVFEAAGALDTPPAVIHVTEGNVTRPFLRREDVAAVAPDDLCGVFASASGLCSVTIRREGDDILIRAGANWPAGAWAVLRHVVGLLYAACDRESGEPIDLHILWPNAQADRDAIEVSMSRLVRLAMRRTALSHFPESRS